MPNTPIPLDDHDRRITSHELNARAPWLDPAQPVTLGHVLRAAADRRREPGAIVSRLAELGYRVPSPEQMGTLVGNELALLSLHTNGYPPWLLPGDTACPRGHVLEAARKVDRRPADVAARLAELGHPAPAPDGFPEQVDHEDCYLVRAPDDGGGGERWIADDAPVPLGHVLEKLRRAGRLSKDPEGAVSAIASARERLTRMGYPIAPELAEVTADDLVLISRGLDGGPPWLPDQDEPVPLHHVLRFAQARDRDPNEVLARLCRLGFHRLPRGPLVGSVSREEAGLLGHTWGGPSWLAQDDPDWFPHLVAVAVDTGKTPAEVADRLRALGYPLPEQELPPAVSESDLALVSSRYVLDAPGFWLSRTDPVPVGHILHSAHVRGTDVASVLTRLAELGHTRLPDVPGRHVTDDDLRLISRHGDGAAPVLGDTVPYGRLLRAAADAGTGPRDAADRYRELGYTDILLPDGPLPESVTEDDADLVATDTGWLAPHEPVPLPHVVRRAHAEGTGPAGIARRLRALGYHDVPAPLPDTPHPGDLIMISRNAEPGNPDIPSTGVEARHVVRAAALAKVGPHEVAARLVSLGYTLEFTPHPDDAVITSEHADGRAPWVWRTDLGRVLLAAKVLGRTPEEINDRCEELGYGRHELPDAGGFEEDDVLLLSEELNGRRPWLSPRSTASPRHVLRAAQATGRSPREIGERLTRLGHTAHVPPALDARDSDLVEVVPDLRRPAGVAEILAVVSRTGASPAEVAARLRELDVEIPDLAYPTRRPAPTPVRLP
ncbi:wHTH domain-containing protein [Streptomyces prasinus]|uniref:wHTH domain-containing protein n=1 Tax=Streptomyces prasinus TaxID=67345 RepID=UPI0036BF63A4